MAIGDITYVGAGSVASGGTNVDIPVPAGVQNGDVLVVQVWDDSNTPAPTTETGWTIERGGAGSTGGSPVRKVANWWRIAGPSEPASYNFHDNVTPCTVISGVMHAFRGAAYAQMEGSAAPYTSGGASNITWNNASSVNDNAWSLASVIDASGTWTPATPSGYTLLGPSSGDFRLFIKEISPPGTASVPAVTGGAAWAGLHFVLGPRLRKVVAIVPTGSGSALTVVTLTYSFTVPVGLLSSALMVGVSIGTLSGGKQTTGVTYGGAAMTLIGRKSPSTPTGEASLWILRNPPPGAANVVVTTNAPGTSHDADIESGAFVLDGVHQLDPVRAFATATANGSGVSSVTVPSEVGDLVVDVLSHGGGGGVANTGNVIRWNIAQNSNTAGGNGLGSTQTGSSPTATIGETITVDNWQQVAASIRSEVDPIHYEQAFGTGNRRAPGMRTPTGYSRETQGLAAPVADRRAPFKLLRVTYQGEAAVGGALFTVTLDGTLTSAGDLLKTNGKALGGTITSSGAINRASSRTTLAGTMTSSGAVTKASTRTTFAGTLTSAGALVKTVGKQVGGTLTSSGLLALLKVKIIALGGTLTSSGTIQKLTTRLLGGTMTSSGAVAKTNKRASLAGTLTSAGALVKTVGKALGGTLTSSGLVTVIKVKIVTLAGTLTSSGAILKSSVRSLAGTLTSSGALTKTTTKPLAGNLTSSGALIKAVIKALGGTMTSSGLLTVIKAKVVTLGGTLTSSGALLKTTTRNVVGTLTSSGLIRRATTRLLGGSVSPTGAITKSTTKAFGGTMTSSGLLAAVKTRIIALAGTLTSSGLLRRATTRNVGGTLTSSGSLRRATALGLGGNLVTAGAIRKGITKVLGGLLTLIGTLVSFIPGQGASVVTVRVQPMVNISVSIAAAVSAAARVMANPEAQIVQPLTNIAVGVQARVQIAARVEAL